MSYEDAVIRIGNKGTVLEMTMYSVLGNTQTVLDLSQGNAYQMEFKRRDNSTQTVTATIKNAPGSNGIITYTDVGGAVFAHTNASKGRWTVRGIIGYSSGNTFKGSWQGFTVGE